MKKSIGHSLSTRNCRFYSTLKSADWGKLCSSPMMRMTWARMRAIQMLALSGRARGSIHITTQLQRTQKQFTPILIVEQTRLLVSRQSPAFFYCSFMSKESAKLLKFFKNKKKADFVFFFRLVFVKPPRAIFSAK